jgi:hypothetical protein
MGFHRIVGGWHTLGLSGSWNCVASSADGAKLVAVGNGYLFYTSTDSGGSWTRRNLLLMNWTSVASSADGTKLVAVGGGGYIYTSSGPVP